MQVNNVPIRVLHVTLNMEIGGAEQVVKQLVENICKEQFETMVLCIDGIIGAMGQVLLKNGTEVFSLARKPGFDLSLIKDLRALLNEKSVDVLHCHQYTPYVYGLLASLGTGVPVIFTEHGRLYPEKYKWKRILSTPILSMLTNSVISISKATADAMVKYENFSKNKIEIVYNGLRHDTINIDREKMCRELQIAPELTIFGTISRLDPIKNQSMMIRAFSTTLTQQANCVLLIIGDGCDRVNLEALVSKLGIQKNVIFTGFKVDPAPYFELIDIFLLSSLSEGTSMTLLESMACSKPSVVTDVGGNSEIVIDSETGFVTPDRDDKAFSVGMLKLLESKDLQKRMGDSASSRYRQIFTEAKMTKEYETRYLKLVKNNVKENRL